MDYYDSEWFKDWLKICHEKDYYNKDNENCHRLTFDDVEKILRNSKDANNKKQKGLE